MNQFNERMSLVFTTLNYRLMSYIRKIHWLLRRAIIWHVGSILCTFYMEKNPHEIAWHFACLSKGQQTYLYINGERRMSLGYKNHISNQFLCFCSFKKCDGSNGTTKIVFVNFVTPIDLFFLFTFGINIVWVFLYQTGSITATAP